MCKDGQTKTVALVELEEGCSSHLRPRRRKSSSKPRRLPVLQYQQPAIDLAWYVFIIFDLYVYNEIWDIILMLMKSMWYGRWEHWESNWKCFSLYLTDSESPATDLRGFWHEQVDLWAGSERPNLDFPKNHFQLVCPTFKIVSLSSTSAWWKRKFKTEFHHIQCTLYTVQ